MSDDFVDHGRKFWFFRMGMLEAYDYALCQHPEQPDDTILMTEWIKKAMNYSVRR